MKKQLILEASVRAAQEVGLDGWSIDRVARGAGCAKGLVVHHFGTRPALLTESGARIGSLRFRRRIDAVAGGGTAALDRLWTVIVGDVGSGLSRAAFGLASHGYPTRGADDSAAFHHAAAECLGIPADSLADPTALTAMLEGIELQLLGGTDRLVARRAYDRLWLTMIEA